MGMVGCGGGEVQTITGHTAGVNSVAFSSDGQRIVSGSRDKTLKIWDANSGQELQTLNARDGTVGPAVPSLLDRTSREPWSTGLEVGHQLP